MSKQVTSSGNINCHVWASCSEVIHNHAHCQKPQRRQVIYYISSFIRQANHEPRIFISTKTEISDNSKYWIVVLLIWVILNYSLFLIIINNYFLLFFNLVDVVQSVCLKYLKTTIIRWKQIGWTTSLFYTYL